VVLEAVIVIGTLAIDPASAPMMANLRLIRLLFDVMNGMCTLTSTPFSDLGQFGLLLFVGDLTHEAIWLIAFVPAAKHQDDDIVMQVLFTFFKLLLHDITRKAVVSHART